MRFRPEAAVWPLLNDDELRKLAADIDDNGQLHPIDVYEDEILDGRNRYLAITRFGKKVTEPRYRKVNPDSPIHHVVSLNEKRRHLSESQRAMAAAKALPFYEAEAKKRQGTRTDLTSAPIGADVPHRAADDAAADFGTNSRNVQRAKSVQKKGSKKLKEAVDQGQLSLGKAEQITKEYPDKAKQDAVVGDIAKSQMTSRVKGLTGEVEWYTPRTYLDAAIKVIGTIDLDPASSAHAQKHVQAKRHFTIEDDGLAQDWSGSVWLNPPYKMPAVKHFVNKMADSWRSRQISQGIMLTNNATDTEWFHTALLAATAVCLTRGRIHFIEVRDGELLPKHSPTCGQAFFYFGPDPDRFADVFEEFGSVVVPSSQHQLMRYWAGKVRSYLAGD